MLQINSKYRLLKKLWLPATAISLATLGCGKPHGKTLKKPSQSQTEVAFVEAARQNKLPVRMIMAAAWLESRLSPELASSLYLNTDTGDIDSHKGVLLAQSAFGVPLSELGLQDREDSGELVVQVEAYAAWLSQKISENVTLNPSPATSDEKVDWVWEIAKAHRPNADESANYSRNVRSIFAKELLGILNQGFIWQDPKSKETIHFAKETPELKQTEFRDDIQHLFNLTTQRPEVDSAMFLRLGRGDTSPVENTPRAIEVVHCPLALSACLELQQQRADDEIRLEAHYVIPQDDQIVPEPLQVTKHDNGVRLTDSKGITNYAASSIVIMLVGNSGRLVDGYRDPANPGWITKWQLQRLGDIVNDVCLNLQDSSGIDVKKCVDGVHFHYQGASEAFRWGDIADYDPLIFSGYLNNPGGLQGDAAFEFASSTREFLAGAPIPIKVVFGPAVKHVELERLVRCPDKKLVWAPVTSEDVRNQTSFALAKRLFDAGPNGNGNQFFRAKVYGNDGSLIGWDTVDVYLRKFEEQTSGMTPKACATQGI